MVRRGVLATVLACSALLGLAASASAALPPIKHVFIIIGENESEATSFGASSPATYLSKTLTSQGAFLPNYYGTGHASLDNYIAMVSGQAPNPSTSADCPTFSDFLPGSTLDPSGQETGSGCVYPSNVPTAMSQLDAAHLTWRGYMDSMGSDLVRDGSATCSHPVLGTPDVTEVQTATDQYATRHDPFVYFHYVIDNAAECNANVVPLTPNLQSDLASAATTPNYVFITPGLCNDGHDTSCPNGQPGGLPQFDQFLQTWVPRITSSPAFQQNGLLLVTFDEAVGDSSFCCGETVGPARGATFGGGVVGAVALSRYITPGTVSTTPYNHFSMLGSVEDIFGLSRIGEAVGTTAFGSDVFTNPSGTTGPTGTTGLTGVTGTTGPTSTAPQISGLTIRPSAIKQKHGAAIGYTDSEAAVSQLVIVRTSAGFRRGHGACRPVVHKRPAHTSKCTVVKTVGGFSHRDTAGANIVPWNGKIKGKALAIGSYLLGVTPQLGTLHGRTRAVSFRVT
jgi:hypothetical protein